MTQKLPATLSTIPEAVEPSPVLTVSTTFAASAPRISSSAQVHD
jgi:hypothetical protein